MGLRQGNYKCFQCRISYQATNSVGWLISSRLSRFRLRLLLDPLNDIGGTWLGTANESSR
jgi:hypothetical protein